MGKAETKTETIETLAEFCKVCGRVAWGEIVRLGFSKWRHESCGIGSQEWLEYYKTLPASEQAKVRSFFLQCYPEKGGTHNEVS